MFKKMGHAAIQVTDLKKSLRLFREVMGLEGNWVSDADWANLKLGDADLSLVRKEGAKHPPHLGFWCDSMPALEDAQFRLKAEGLKVEDTLITNAQGFEFITLGSNWPTIEIGGRTRPAIQEIL